MKRRVVVTGLGAITPIGNDVATFWDSIRNGRCGVAPITRFDASTFDVKIAAEVKNFNMEPYADKKDIRKMALFTQYAVAAAVQAMQDAGLDETKIDKWRTGIMLGNGIGGYEVMEASFHKYAKDGVRRIMPLTIPMIINNEAAGNIAMRYGIRGPALTMVTACASATDAIGCSLDMVRDGRCDVCLTGGTEAAITGFAIGGFQILKALTSKFNDQPEKASRPFDKDRSGFVMGEGAAVLVVEELEHARRRGATIYAELSGYGATCDAYHLTAPDPEAEGFAQAMKVALEDAALKPEDVQYYNAHGTSTEINDPTETKSLKKAFGDHAYKMKVSSTKSMTGHCVGAAGAIEAIACIMAIRDGFYPPTINLDNPDIESGCDLDYVPNQGQPGVIDAAASGSLGFGGHNGVVIFRRFQ
jgi:3-oxoacyl-[acyl-carrier-protein] synthase II